MCVRVILKLLLLLVSLSLQPLHLIFKEVRPSRPKGFLDLRLLQILVQNSVKLCQILIPTKACNRYTRYTSYLQSEQSAGYMHVHCGRV